MSQYEVWHNPSCSKSRAARDELTRTDGEVVLRLYRQQPPTVPELHDVLQKLGAQPWDITRFGEPVATQIGIAEWQRDDATRDDWIAALVANPVLIQRPIVISGDRAVVAREAGWRQRLE